MNKNIALIGTGYWGKNHARVLNELKDVNFDTIVDVNEKNGRPLARRYHTDYTTNYEDVINNDDIDAVFICTPNSTHYEIAKRALEAGKDVFVEKPMCLNVSDAIHLNQIATDNDRILMVGHIFSYNSAINTLKTLIDKRELGELYFMISSRLGLFPPRLDSGVIYDLAIHDIDTIQYLLNRKLPVMVEATGKSYLRQKYEEVAFISLEFENDIIAHINASWLTPAKIRNFWISGTKKTAYVDLMTQVLEIFEQRIEKVPNGNHNNGTALPDPLDYNLITKQGISFKPLISAKEPMAEEDSHFIDCIVNRKRPLTDGNVAISTLLVADAAVQSLNLKKPIEMDSFKDQFTMNIVG